MQETGTSAQRRRRNNTRTATPTAGSAVLIHIPREQTATKVDGSTFGKIKVDGVNFGKNKRKRASKNKHHENKPRQAMYAPRHDWDGLGEDRIDKFLRPVAFDKVVFHREHKLVRLVGVDRRGGEVVLVRFSRLDVVEGFGRAVPPALKMHIGHTIGSRVPLSIQQDLPKGKKVEYMMPHRNCGGISRAETRDNAPKKCRSCRTIPERVGRPVSTYGVGGRRLVAMWRERNRCISAISAISACRHTRGVAHTGIASDRHMHHAGPEPEGRLCYSRLMVSGRTCTRPGYLNTFRFR